MGKTADKKDKGNRFGAAAPAEKTVPVAKASGPVRRLLANAVRRRVVAGVREKTGLSENEADLLVSQSIGDDDILAAASESNLRLPTGILGLAAWLIAHREQIARLVELIVGLLTEMNKTDRPPA